MNKSTNKGTKGTKNTKSVSLDADNAPEAVSHVTSEYKFRMEYNPINLSRLVFIDECDTIPISPIFADNDEKSVINTFRYMFYKYKKGIYLKIKNNKLHKFISFDNINYRNEWSDKINIPSDVRTYLYNIDPRNKSVNSNVKEWYANNSLIRFEYPASTSNTNVDVLYDMFKYLCETTTVPDIELFINRRDFPILREDRTEAYYHIFGKGVQLLSHNYSTYSPILSMSKEDGYADVLLPTVDDWVRVMYDKKYYNKYELRTYDDDFSTNWDEKLSVAVFRGSSTGTGIDEHTNQRLKAAVLHIQQKNLADYPLIDAGITKWNTRLRKIENSSSLQLIDVKRLHELYGVELVGNLSPYEQSKYKYVIHISGHVSAYRLSYEMSYGSCILLVRSNYKVWFQDRLIEYVHYIPVKEDLSDLVDIIRWCRINDSQVKQIAINAKKFYNLYLSQKGIIRYLRDVIINMKQTVGNYVYPKSNIRNHYQVVCKYKLPTITASYIPLHLYIKTNVKLLTIILENIQKFLRDRPEYKHNFMLPEYVYVHRDKLTITVKKNIINTVGTSIFADHVFNDDYTFMLYNLLYINRKIYDLVKDDVRIRYEDIKTTIVRDPFMKINCKCN